MGEAQFPDGTIVTTTSTSVFLSKWDNNGQLTWVKPLQSTSPTEVSDLDLDTAGNAYIAGVFEGTTDFDPGAGTAIRVASSDGRGDGYLLKLDSEGNYQAVKQVGGAERQWVYSVNVAVDGAVYGSGYFKTEAGLPTGEWLTSAGDSDAFLFKLAPDAPTKFFVVDGSADRTDEYDAGGNRTDAYSLATASGNLSPRGAASNLTGDRLWVIDANRKVYVYDGNGTPLGSWTAGGLTSPQGITVHGSDLWIVDDSTDRVYKYAGATTRTAGTQNATTNFKLNVKNDKSKDLVTDGTSIWTVNDDLTDKVFKYTLAGALLGSWTIDGRNVSPTGITLDPTNPTDLWIVDNAADQVFAYVNATSRTTGSQSAAVAINLALGSSDPQGIADPPADAVDRLFAQLDKSSSDSTDEQDATARQAHFVDVALSAGAHPTYKRTRRSN